MKAGKRWYTAVRIFVAWAVLALFAGGAFSVAVANGGGGIDPAAEATGLEQPPAGGGRDDSWRDLDVLDLSSAIRAALLHAPEVALARLQRIDADLANGQDLGFLPPNSVEYLDALHARHEARERFRESLIDAAETAEELFYGALRAQQILELQERRAEYTETQLAVARTRHAAGTLASVDLFSVELDHRQALADLQDAVRSHAAALRALAAITGIEPLPPLAWSEEDFAYAPVTIALSHVIDHARLAHREVLGAQRALERAKRRLELDRTAGAPPVQQRRGELAVMQAEIRLAQAIQRAEEEARRLWDEVQSAEAALLLQQERLVLTRRRLQLTQTRYDAGSASWMDLFAAQTELLRAQLDASEALWDYNLKKARLLRLAGQGEPLLIPPEYQELLR